jgi:hypothetical protein
MRAPAGTKVKKLPPVDRVKNAYGQDVSELAQENRGGGKPMVARPATNTEKAKLIKPVKYGQKDKPAEPELRYKGPQTPINTNSAKNVTSPKGPALSYPPKGTLAGAIMRRYRKANSK